MRGAAWTVTRGMYRAITKAGHSQYRTMRQRAVIRGPISHEPVQFRPPRMRLIGGRYDP